MFLQIYFRIFPSFIFIRFLLIIKYFLQIMFLIACHMDGKNITEEIAVFLLSCELL